jgi:hypothetical protein
MSKPYNVRFKELAARNAARIPQEKWNEHKAELASLYQERTLKEIMIHMETAHTFVPT